MKTTSKRDNIMIVMRPCFTLIELLADPALFRGNMPLQNDER